MACRMVMPAFSISFFVRPSVTQTLNDGETEYTSDFAPEGPAGRFFARVMSTFCERHCVAELLC